MTAQLAAGDLLHDSPVAGTVNRFTGAFEIDDLILDPVAEVALCQKLVLVAPSKLASKGVVTVQTGETHDVVWA